MNQEASIWFHPDLSVETLNQQFKINALEVLKIEFTKIGPDYIDAQIKVDKTHLQPLGLLHGGISCVLAETVGSVAGNLVLNHKQQYAVGLEINANHIKSARTGDTVIARATAVHIGRNTQVWSIKIKNQSGQLICVSRLTNAVKTVSTSAKE